jgi:putative transferase (TIGR04331 family)
MFVDTLLQVARSDEVASSENTVYIDWWAAGKLIEPSPERSVLLHEFSESESFALADIEGDFFSLLTGVLNDLHCTRHSRRYWRIVLGAWHQEFFFTFADRHARLLQASNTFPKMRIVSIGDNPTESAPEDGTHFSQLTGDSSWETIFCSKIVKLMNEHQQLTNIEIVESLSTSSTPPKQIVKIPKQPLKVRVIQKVDSVAGFLDKFSKFELQDTYLSRMQEFQLRWRLKNFSFLRLGEGVATTTPVAINSEMRSSIRQQLIQSADGDTFQVVLGELIADYLPANYVESFSRISEQVCTSITHYPAVYFTSNRFGMSDVERFKIAEKVTRGSKYVVAQHGNNYGVTFRPRTLPEEETSDLFLRWGNAFGDSERVIGVSTRGLRIPRNSRIRKRDQQSFLIVGSQPPARTFRYYDWNQYYASENHTMALVRNFVELKQQVLYRPYGGHVFGGGVTKEFQSWLDQNPVALSTGSFKQALSQSSMVIFLYDSTGFLELLSEDRPCLQIQMRPTAHISAHFQPLYNDMIRVGLLHEDVDTAMGIVKSPSCIREWWDSSEVRKVRESVSDAFAVRNGHIVGDLAMYLKQNAAKFPVKSD